MSAVGFGGGVDPSQVRVRVRVSPNPKPDPNPDPNPNQLCVLGTGEEAAATAAAAAAARTADVAAEEEEEVVVVAEEAAAPEPVAAPPPPPLSCELSEGRLCLEAPTGVAASGFVTLRNLGRSLLHYRWARRQRQPEQAANLNPKP